jgi:hypothetical protein
MAGLKATPRAVKGRCSRCAYFDVVRRQHARARVAGRGDAWAEDPGCYLDDDELGIAPAASGWSRSPTCAAAQGPSASADAVRT